MIFNRSIRPMPLLLAASLFFSPVLTRADFRSALSKFLQKDVDVLTVTDVSEAGKSYAPATPERPVRYMMIHLGSTSFSSDWGGEKVPANKVVLRWIMTALRTQGYLLADALHPPEQVFVFGWGMFGSKTGEPPLTGPKLTAEDFVVEPTITIFGSRHRALKFLGGDKVNLMWEQEKYGGFVDQRVLMRGLIRTGVAGKVWDFSEGDLFVGRVRAYPVDLLKNPKAPMLWETRFGCPATGLSLDKALPLMITAAAPNIGRETIKPVSVNATRAFGSVSLGEFKVLGTDENLSKPTSNSEKHEASPPQP